MSFHDHLRAKLTDAPGARLPWSEVMALALYHPEHGYYGPGPRKIGRAGDFYTSVSVGPLFGRLLAQLVMREWEAQGKPAGFTIIEQGAHDGQLAADVMDAVANANVPLRYLLVEPNPRYREAQKQMLAAHQDRVAWVEGLAELANTAAPQHGFFLCNELPDAFPVHLARWTGMAWEELYVAEEGSGQLTMLPGALSCEGLAEELDRIPAAEHLQPGHILEVNLAMLNWVDSLSKARFEGGIFIADYGLDAEEFWDESRAAGTLRRYYQHRMDGQVLKNLGECDLTTHINFSRLIEAAASHGLTKREYDLQGRVLMRIALPWLQSFEGRPMNMAMAGQLQSLTHPGFMGRSFRCLILNKPAGAVADV